MSEFKFACPVCGQHITADSSASGGQLECPTCFRKIVVPQAPKSAETKFILSAAQAEKPHPPRPVPSASPEPSAPSKSTRRVALIAVIAAVVCGGVGVGVFWGRIFKSDQTQGDNTSGKKGRGGRQAHPIPKNVKWTLDLAKASVPDGVAAGNIHGRGFLCERASLQGNNLTLREGRFGPIELGLTVWVPAQRVEDLSGKTIEVTKEQGPPVPRVTLHWQGGNQPPATTDFDKGYAMRLVFDQAAGGRVHGKIFISLPDADKSVVAGTFDVEPRSPGGGRRGSRGG